VESADGRLVVQRRGKQVANRPRSLSASVTGVVDAAEIARGRRGSLGLPDLLRCVTGETFRELGVKPSESVFLGMVRELQRGGKPEFYFFARSALAFDTIRSRWQTAQEKYETDRLESFELHTPELSGDFHARHAFLNQLGSTLESKSVARDGNLTLIVGLLLLACLVVPESFQMR